MYDNGDIPLEALVEVETDLHLETATAAAYLRMKAEAARSGVTLAIPRPAGAYRSLFVQQDMHDRPWLYNLDPTSSVPIAPAGSSTHGLGDRVDIVRGTAGDWAIANASRFGFVREFGDADPRHFRFTAPTWAAGDVIPIIELEESTVTVIRNDDTGKEYLIRPFVAIKHLTAEQSDNAEKAFGKHTYQAAGFRNLLSACGFNPADVDKIPAAGALVWMGTVNRINAHTTDRRQELTESVMALHREVLAHTSKAVEDAATAILTQLQQTGAGGGVTLEQVDQLLRQQIPTTFVAAPTA